MQTTTQTARAPRPQSILWQWTGVSALLHMLVIGALCGVSYLGLQKRETASKAKVAEQEAAAAKAEAAEAAKTPPAPANAAAPSTPAVAPAPSPVVAEKAPAPTTPPVPPPVDPNAPVQAEKVLGIDKVAKPEETPKSPFAGKDDDLLKDLK